MSYDISLYDRGFLKMAITTGLGDWTGAPSLPVDATEALVKLAEAGGFVESPLDAELISFMLEEGHTPGKEYILEKPGLSAMMSVFRGQIAFAVPYSDRPQDSIAVCTKIARSIADEYALGYYDPQTGEQP